jgi:antitoxin VapB
VRTQFAEFRGDGNRNFGSLIVAPIGRIRHGTLGPVRARTSVELVIYHGIYSREDNTPLARTAKLFRNGRSQAVRLPAEYRFEGSEVYIRRDPESGDIVISRRPDSWEDFFDLADRIGVPDEFLSDRDNTAPQKRRLV